MRPLVFAAGIAILLGSGGWGIYTAAKAENECVRVNLPAMPEQLEAIE